MLDAVRCSMSISRDDPRITWPGPIIDCHAHPRSTGAGAPLDTDLTDDLVAYSRSMRVLAMGSLGEVLFRRTGFSEIEIRWLNDRTAELSNYVPGFFIPFCFLDPTLGDAFVREEIDRCHREFGFRAIKLEIACNVAEPATDPVFARAAELGFPVLVHSTDTEHMGNRGQQSDSEDVRAAARRNPDTQMIMAHLTSAGYRGVQAIEDLPNVVIDTSGMQPEAGIVEYAVSRLGDDRVLFGSDMYGRDLPVQIAQVIAADIPDASKRKIFYDNASKLLGVDPASDTGATA